MYPVPSALQPVAPAHTKGEYTLVAEGSAKDLGSSSPERKGMPVVTSDVSKKDD